MCGISGIVNKKNVIKNRKEIKDITDLIEHRGPNSEGFFYGNTFSLGHRRLSIIDLSEDGRQPMSYFDYTIIFNGEIYNYLELKEELVLLNYSFNTNTDTEIILAAYSAWGIDCLNKFNGMWSFCIYDPLKQELFCARDRFGVKPFYYLNNDDKFVFGSEIKQLLYFQKDRYVDEEVLANYFINQTEYDDKTFFKEIYKLPQSHYLIYNLKENSFDIFRYYELDIRQDIQNQSEDKIVDNISKLLESSIALRLRSDVRVGTCLSGGLDSSSVAAIASKKYESDELFWAIHAKSSEKYTDESNFANDVKTHCNLNLKVITPSKEDFLNNLETVIYNQEEPFASTSIYMQHFVFREAKALGCTVMLDGQGGDETLLGYERYYFSYLSSLPINKRLKAILQIPKKSRLSLKTAISYYFFFNFYFLRANYNKRKASFLKPFLKKKLRKDLLSTFAKIFPHTSELQKFELMKVQLPNLLKYEDKNSMAHSIESRLPFLDYRFVEYAISIEPGLKMKGNWSKYILRKAMERVLPENIIWRKEKRGFEAPENTWLEDSQFFLEEINNSSFIKDICKRIPSKLDNDLLWKLYNVSVWARLYEVKLAKQ